VGRTRIPFPPQVAAQAALAAVLRPAPRSGAVALALQIVGNCTARNTSSTRNGSCGWRATAMRACGAACRHRYRLRRGSSAAAGAAARPARARRPHGERRLLDRLGIPYRVLDPRLIAHEPALAPVAARIAGGGVYRATSRRLSQVHAGNSRPRAAARRQFQARTVTAAGSHAGRIARFTPTAARSRRCLVLAVAATRRCWPRAARAAAPVFYPVKGYSITLPFSNPAAAAGHAQPDALQIVISRLATGCVPPDRRG